MIFFNLKLNNWNKNLKEFQSFFLIVCQNKNLKFVILMKVPVISNRLLAVAIVLLYVRREARQK
jgi:hypothetical protein